MDKLLVAVLGNRDSGKTTTWSRLFGGTVRTGKHARELYLSETEYVEVFLISGSPEERGKDVEELLQDDARIVLCSTQYRKGVEETYQYFLEKDYYIYVQWLNPGHGDIDAQYFDSLGIAPWLLSAGATITIRNGKNAPEPRVREIRDFIYGWAKSRRLIRVKNA